MSKETTMLERAQAAYAKRLTAAAISVALATGSGRMLFSGAAGEHWLAILLCLCISASAGMMLTLDVLTRRLHIKGLAIIDEAPKPFGETGTTPRDTAAHDLGRKNTDYTFH